MSKKTAGKASVLALTASMVVTSFFTLSMATTNVGATQTPPTCGTFDYSRSDNQGDFSDDKVSIDFTDYQNYQGSSNDGYYKISIQGNNGWSVTNWYLEVANNNTSGWDVTGSGNISNYNPTGNQIEDVMVTVSKACATPTPSPTPQHISVTICHATGSNSNPYTQITVDDDAVDGNGNSDHNRSGHQNGEDIIPHGSWDTDGRNWDAAGQAIWNNQCNLVSTPSPTATPTPSATPSATPSPTATATPSATPSPTATPVATETPIATSTPESTSTPEATSTPQESSTPIATATPNGDVCLNLEGIQTSLPDTYHFDNDGVNCLQYELGGPPSDPGNPQVLGIGGGGDVLGASTMAGTGNFAENFYMAIMSLGGTFIAKGVKEIKKALKLSK